MPHVVGLAHAGSVRLAGAFGYGEHGASARLRRPLLEITLHEVVVSISRLGRKGAHLVGWAPMDGQSSLSVLGAFGPVRSIPKFNCMPCEINIKCPRLLKFDRLKFDGSFLAPLLKLTKTAIGKTRELGEGASTLAVARASPCEVTVNVTARSECIHLT